MPLEGVLRFVRVKLSVPERAGVAQLLELVVSKLLVTEGSWPAGKVGGVGEGGNKGDGGAFGGVMMLRVSTGGREDSDKSTRTPLLPPVGSTIQPLLVEPESQPATLLVTSTVFQPEDGAGMETISVEPHEASAHGRLLYVTVVSLHDTAISRSEPGFPELLT